MLEEDVEKEGNNELSRVLTFLLNKPSVYRQNRMMMN